MSTKQILIRITSVISVQNCVARHMIATLLPSSKNETFKSRNTVLMSALLLHWSISKKRDFQENKWVQFMNELHRWNLTGWLIYCSVSLAGCNLPKKYLYLWTNCTVNSKDCQWFWVALKKLSNTQINILFLLYNV